MPDFGSGQSAYVVRDVEIADTAEIYKLYRAVEPEDDIGPESYDLWWRWLHAMNPVNLRYVLGGFTGDGRNVGHVALTPFKFVVDGHVLTAGFPCQLMVDETLRKSLLYPTLVKRLLKDYAKNGFDFCYASVTRPRVLQANIALGFKRNEVFPIYARPYRAGKVVAERLGKAAILARPVVGLGDIALRLGWPFGQNRTVSVAEVPSFPEAAEAFLDAVRGRFALAALRTVPILNWRFTAYSDRGYRILLATEGGHPVGYAVVRRMPMKMFDVLALVDLLFDPNRPDIGHALLNRVHRMAISSGVDLATTMIAPHSPFTRLLRLWGFIRTPEGFTLVTHEPRDGLNRLSERPFADWHLTWFDHDFV